MRDLLVENEFGLPTRLNLAGKDSTHTGYGVFAGYNIQIDEAVLGIEADFTRVQLKGVGADRDARRFSASTGYDHNALLTGQASSEINDFGTLRARAGISMGSFLPYVTGGIALGRATTRRTALVDSVDQSPVSPHPVTNQLQAMKAISPKETLALGYAVGVGVDVAVTPNIMLRAEYQYIHFNDVAGHRIGVNNVRAGASVKF
jgi:outer membrane immunogenic protein